MTTNDTLNNINMFIEQARQTIMCDSACKQKKGEQSLKQEYLNAQTNVITAPEKLIEAEKKYIIFTKGDSGYNEYEDNLIHEKAEKITNLFIEFFEKEKNDISSENNTYRNLFNNSTNVSDLYTRYKKDNDFLIKKLKNMTNDVLTNDRKTYYENQGIEYLKSFYSYSFTFVYSLFMIVYIYIAFAIPSHLTFIYRILLLFGLLLLPFFSSYIISIIIETASIIYGFFPKNSYLSL
jgi:hypothetical protein